MWSAELIRVALKFPLHTKSRWSVSIELIAGENWFETDPITAVAFTYKFHFLRILLVNEEIQPLTTINILYTILLQSTWHWMGPPNNLAMIITIRIVVELCTGAGNNSRTEKHRWFFGHTQNTPTQNRSFYALAQTVSLWLMIAPLRLRDCCHWCRLHEPSHVVLETDWLTSD